MGNSPPWYFPEMKRRARERRDADEFVAVDLETVSCIGSGKRRRNAEHEIPELLKV
jgi:hypothetical protein